MRGDLLEADAAGVIQFLRREFLAGEGGLEADGAEGGVRHAAQGFRAFDLEGQRPGVRAQFLAAIDDRPVGKTGFGQDEGDRLVPERLEKLLLQQEAGLDRHDQGQYVGQGRGGGIGKTLGECGAIRFGRAFGGEDGSEEEIRCWHLG